MHNFAHVMLYVILLKLLSQAVAVVLKQHLTKCLLMKTRPIPVVLKLRYIIHLQEWHKHIMSFWGMINSGDSFMDDLFMCDSIKHVAWNIVAPADIYSITHDLYALCLRLAQMHLSTP
jgi:hypothetical protein